MANKLYEETAVSNIAEAIRETTTGTNDKYTVSQMADAIRSGNRRIYKGTVTSTIVGAGKYLTIAKEDILAQIRNEAELHIRVNFDIEPTAYTVFRARAANDGTILLNTNPSLYQNSLRYDASANYGSGSVGTSINAATVATQVAYIHITADGELRIYSNSSSYAIRPSNYIAIVEW